MTGVQTCALPIYEMSGVSFLPSSEHTYQQAPYEDITEDQYNKMKLHDYTISWDNFKEEEDNTEGAQQLACVSGVCEIV